MIVLLSLLFHAAPLQDRAAGPPLWLVGRWQIGARSSPLCGDLQVEREKDGSLSGAFSGYFKPGGERWTIDRDFAPLLRLDPGTNHAASYRYSRSTPDSIEFLDSGRTELRGVRFAREADGNGIKVELIGSDGGGASYRYRRAVAPCKGLPPPRRAYPPIPRP